MTPVYDLALEWEQSSSNKEKARIEAQIWAKISDRGRGGIGAGLATLLGDKPKKIAIRHALLRAQADLLWERVDAKMPLSTAARILVAARKRAGDKPLADSLRAELAYYDSLDVATTPDGRVFRRRSPKRLRRDGSMPAKASNWTKIRAQIAQHVEPLLRGCDSMAADRIRQDFESDLDSAMETLKARAKRASASAAPAVSRQDLVDACAFFGIDPPPPGAPVPPKLAKSKWRAAARAYHPDASGDENLRHLFEAARKAHEAIDLHNESVNSRGSHV